MCEPWGSFLVNNQGDLYAKDGVLSHTRLLEELTGERAHEPDGPASPWRNFGIGVRIPRRNVERVETPRWWQPEYDWVSRTLRDLEPGKTGLVNFRFWGETPDMPQPSARALKRSDEYVREQFGTPMRFLAWLERGNWFPDYFPNYQQLLVPSALLINDPEVLLTFSHPCQFVSGVRLTMNERDYSHEVQFQLTCQRCGEGAATSWYSRQFAVNSRWSPRLIVRSGEPNIVRLESGAPTPLRLETFADLWRDPANRIEAWRN